VKETVILIGDRPRGERGAMQRNDLQARVRAGFGKFGGRLALLIIALGLLIIGLAWNGAAGIPVLAAQTPYVLSGLGLGLGLVIVGAALMLVQSGREDRERLEAKFDALLDAMQRGGSVTGATAAAPADLAGLVVAGTASYHVPGCRLVDGREDTTYLTPDEARSRFLTPCRVCQPDSQPSNVNVV
jgi:hypothetical protein